MSMTDDAQTFYEEKLTDDARESVRKLIAEGKHDRARRMIEEKAWEHEIKLSDSDTLAILDEFTTDLTADEATMAHFPDKRNKPDMGMDVHESITDPHHRSAPNPSELDQPESDD